MRTKKILFDLLVFVFVAVCALPVSAQQEAPETLISGDWQYQIVDGTVKLTGYSGFARELEIPDNIDQLPVSVIGDDLFRDHTEIERVILPDSVVTIGRGAFSGCTSLTDIRLPAELLRIQNEAFRYCSSLRQLELPPKLTTIAYAAFEGCSALDNLVIPDSVTTIGGNAFRYCSALQTLTISKRLSSLAGDAFAYTPWLTGQKDEFVVIGNKILLKYNGTEPVVTVPQNITAIVDAFVDNVTLEEVLLPESLTTIGDNAFSGALNLRTITLPSNLNGIGSYAFKGCRTLQEIEIPEKVTYINAGAFQECANLRSVGLPSRIKVINARQFAFCPALERLTIPASVETIDATAFENSPAVQLEVVYGTPGEEFAKARMMPYEYLIEKTADFSFLRSENGSELLHYIGQVYDIRVPDYIDGAPVWRIGAGAFQESTFVRNVTLPETVHEIGDWAFAYSEALETLRIADGTSEIGANAFAGCANLRELVIPASVTEIGADAFADCPALTIQAIRDSAAWQEAQRLGIPVDDPLSAIGDFNFSVQGDVYALTEYTGTESTLGLISEVLGMKVTKVGDAVFRGLSVEEVRIPEGYHIIGDSAFAAMNGPLTVILPDSLSEIAPNAFEGTQVTFRAHTGTVAETFAREHGIKFLVLHDNSEF